MLGQCIFQDTVLSAFDRAMAESGQRLRVLLTVEDPDLRGLRTVAKDGALQALAESKPGVQQARRDLELEAARAEAARLGEALKELAVRLLLVEGKGRWG